MSDSNINRLLNSLANSKFRGSFHLNNKMQIYVKDKGLETIKIHASLFINKRLKPACPQNDGKQTPMRQVHPVFIAQHATGTCCRGCLERVHHIPKGRELTNKEIEYIVRVIMIWVERETTNEK